MKKIKFTNEHGINFFPPKSATKQVPQWFKDTVEYQNDKKEVKEDATVSHTIKKCIPVFDAMTAGYILFTQVDVYVLQKDGMPYYTWSSQGALTFHPVWQAENHPESKGINFPKWENPYGIQTAPGYSLLLVPPMHNPNGFFKIFPGFVDTDTYTAPINFPFQLDDISFEGLIPAGTPMAQVIPIKRDSWKMEFGDEKDVLRQKQTLAKLKTRFFNSYKNYFWSKKEYR
jgi:hypothetical protein